MQFMHCMHSPTCLLCVLMPTPHTHQPNFHSLHAENCIVHLVSPEPMKVAPLDPPDSVFLPVCAGLPGRGQLRNPYTF